VILVEEKRNIFADKNVLVVGLARSGVGASNLLSAFGAKVTVTDSKSRESLEGQIRKLAQPVRVITGDNPVDVFESCDMIVVSPGVPLDIQPLLYARRRGIHIIGELELAYQVIKSGIRGQGSGVREKTETATEFIGITGTNGKSTVTTLVDLMLNRSGRRTLLGGNIGNALTEEILKTGVREEKNIDFVVAEISSFQLESIESFRPGIAAILNITPDHLNRYKSMDDYINAKARIFENQLPEDYLVLNADDPTVMKMAEERFSAGNVKVPNTLFFSRKNEVKGVYCRDGELFCNIPNLDFPSSKFPFISQEEIKIKGVHNLENAMAASLIALISGLSYQPVRDALKTFSGLEHRLEFVSEINGIQFMNDSKATNIGAVEKSLEGLDHVILIMGGMDKGSDFSVLHDLIKRKVKSLILIGEAKETIERALRGITEIQRAEDLREAVALSFREASAGDTVLLSPGCASFDMFKDFEERGRRFKEIVKEVHDK
jgi:UDP-N-acetylmuramoylalanine--D-glutamate ligase